MADTPSPDPTTMLADASEIAFPRYSGTPGNRRARDIVAERLRAAGLEVRQQEFSYDLRPALRAIRLVLTTSAVLAAVAGGLATRRPGAALLCLVLGALVGGVMLVWAPGAERLYRRPGPTVTWNVSGHRRAATPRMTLILLAHYDSKSQNLSFPFRMGFTLLAIGSGLALGLVLMLRSASITGTGAWSPPLLGGLAAASLLALATLRNGNVSPGGVDNAGSVAILLELARSLPARVPDDVELIFLSPGAEEDHMIGAMRWLDANRHEWGGRPVRALNFDGAGAPGRPVILEFYGLFHRFAPRIARLARAAAGRMNLGLRRVWLPPAMGIDAIPFHHRGLECLTFSSGSLGRATIAVHSAGDVAGNLDGDALACVARLALAVCDELCRPTTRGTTAR